MDDSIANDINNDQDEDDNDNVEEEKSSQNPSSTSIQGTVEDDHSATPFPEVVFDMVTNEADDNPSSAISWTHNGEAFAINEAGANLSGILRNYFNHEKYSSLQRQLNMYGWKKHVQGKYKGSFHHPYFQKDKREMVERIKRRPPPKRNRKRSHARQSTRKSGSNESASADTCSSSVGAASEGEGTSGTVYTCSDNDGTTSVGDTGTGTGTGTGISAEDDNEDDDNDAIHLKDDTMEENEMENDSKNKTIVEEATIVETRGASEDNMIIEEHEAVSRPEAKFDVLQRVYAKDQDGILYEAVVRRRMYGPHNHKPVQIGLVKSEKELEELLEQGPEHPSWHYFVHYNKWNVNWDRWVSEEDVYELTEQNKQMAARIIKEHRALQQQFKAKRKSKQLDGTAFLREWRKRMDIIESETKQTEEGTQPAAAVPNDDEKEKAKKKRRKTRRMDRPENWNEASVERERKLREKDLAGKREQFHATKIVLPFSLKKVLVEAWEIISQCRMVASLPASITIREALDKYVQSKLGIVQSESDDNEDKEEAVNGGDGEIEQSKTKGNEEKKKEKIKNKDENRKGAVDNESLGSLSKNSANDAIKKEWMDVAEGIALFFDEALPFRLLYRQEKPQYQALMSKPENDQKRMSDIYGCEHLLRLFLRLPEILSEDLTEAEMRPIFGKVNDFVRFLHKHQATLFTEAYRKLDESELHEQQKIARSADKKRKRNNANASTSPTSASGDNNNSASKKSCQKTSAAIETSAKKSQSKRHEAVNTNNNESANSSSVAS